MNIFEKLGERWGIHSTWQVLLILIVFSCTGFTILFVKKYVFALLGIASDDPFWFRTLMWLLTILPLYHVFLLLYGALFGQFEFFWAFNKKIISRFVPDRIKENSD